MFRLHPSSPTRPRLEQNGSIARVFAAGATVNAPSVFSGLNLAADPKRDVVEVRLFGGVRQ